MDIKLILIILGSVFIVSAIIDLVMAIYVKQHLASKGHSISSSVFFAPLFESNFWPEVVTLNKSTNDETISFVISLKRINIIICIAICLMLFFVLYEQDKSSEFALLPSSQ